MACCTKQLLRGLMNIRLPRKIGREFLKVQDEYLKAEIAAKGITEVEDLHPICEGLYLWQGDYGLWQCSKACHNKTYDNEKMVYQMVSEQRDMRISTELVPKCPVCGAPMTMNLRILFLELGVGANTPAIIKYPFWQITAANPGAVYACVNYGEAVCPQHIERQSVCLDEDIGKVIHDIFSSKLLVILDYLFRNSYMSE